MPFARKTLTQLRDTALQDVKAARIFDATTGAVINPVLLEFDPLTIGAKQMAGLAYEQYGYLDYISLQSTPATATDEAALSWGALVKETPKAATPHTGTATLPGVPGSLVPAGTELYRADGVSYSTQADATVAAGAVSVTVSYQADLAGSSGTMVAGAALTLNVPGMAASGTVTTVIAPGTDDELVDDFRDRYLARFASPAQGGAASDYLAWALAVPGVTRAWCLPNGMGAGTVIVYTMWDLARAGFQGFAQGSNGVAASESRDTPASGDQLVVADAIYPLRPVTALVYSVTPVPLPISFALHPATAIAIGSALDLAVRSAISASLLDLADPLGTVVQLGNVEASITAVAGMPQFTLEGPTLPITPAIGQLPVLGTLTYV